MKVVRPRVFESVTLKVYFSPASACLDMNRSMFTFEFQTLLRRAAKIIKNDHEICGIFKSSEATPKHPPKILEKNGREILNAKLGIMSKFVF